MLNTDNEFSSDIEASIVEGMKNLFGKDGMHALLFHLQIIEFARNPKEFHKKLMYIFGSGAITLEKIIIKELFSRLHLPYQEKEEFNFAKYLELAQQVSSTRLIAPV